MATRKPAEKASAKTVKAEAPPKAIRTAMAAKGAKSAAAAKSAKPPKGTVPVQEGKPTPRKRAEAPKGVASAAPSIVAIETLVLDRDRMVAEAAYYRAERRGFSPGAELEDWLEAEAEINRLLGR